MLKGFVGMLQKDLAIFVQHYIPSVAVKKLPAHFFFQPGNECAKVRLRYHQQLCGFGDMLLFGHYFKVFEL